MPDHGSNGCMTINKRPIRTAGCLAQRPADLLSNLPPAGDLTVVHYFPEHPDKQIPAGDIVSAPRARWHIGPRGRLLSHCTRPNRRRAAKQPAHAAAACRPRALTAKQVGGAMCRGNVGAVRRQCRALTTRRTGIEHEHAPLRPQISVVVSAHNTGSKPMNLSAIVGSINSPEKYDMFIQNFTIGVRTAGGPVESPEYCVLACCGGGEQGQPAPGILEPFIHGGCAAGLRSAAGAWLSALPEGPQGVAAAGGGAACRPPQAVLRPAARVLVVHLASTGEAHPRIKWLVIQNRGAPTGEARCAAARP